MKQGMGRPRCMHCQIISKLRMLLFSFCSLHFITWTWHVVAGLSSATPVFRSSWINSPRATFTFRFPHQLEWEGLLRQKTVPIITDQYPRWVCMRVQNKETPKPSDPSYYLKATIWTVGVYTRVWIQCTEKWSGINVDWPSHQNLSGLHLSI